MRHEKWAYRIIVLLIIMQLAVILLSWLLAALSPELHVHSLLSPGGIRWYVGSLVSNMASPPLVWLIMIMVVINSLHESGLWRHLFYVVNRRKLQSQQRFAMRITLVVLLLQLCCLGVLTLPSHAILLSVTGVLFPGSLSSGLIPVLCLVPIGCSLTFALLSGRAHNITDLGRCLTANRLIGN